VAKIVFKGILKPNARKRRTEDTGKDLDRIYRTDGKLPGVFDTGYTEKTHGKHGRRFNSLKSRPLDFSEAIRPAYSGKNLLRPVIRG
jgi:hypothetical protein